MRNAARTPASRARHVEPALRLPRALALATLVDAPPAGDQWLHEQKYDGYRILAVIDHHDIRLWSRRFKEWTQEFPAIVRALASLPAKRAILDGEVAVVLPDGRTTFQGLQNSFKDPRADLVYFAFDLLALDDLELTALPLEERKADLARLISSHPLPGTIRYSDHVIGHGAKVFREACKHGLEGIVSKRRDKPYTPGRTMLWQKTKCVQRQEFVIGGFTDPEGSRSGFGSLLVGYYENQQLVYAGKVGTGYSQAALKEVRGLLAPMVVAKCPFQPEPSRSDTGPKRHWVAAELVCEVQFAEWTHDGKLRHPSFQGLRRDKPAIEVTRDRPQASEPA